MAQITYAFVTVRGAQKIAAALAAETAIDLTHIAIGDGATVPSGGETALYHEVARKTISGQGTVAGALNTLYADIYLAAADGPYIIREAGLFDAAGELIAIARVDPPINKPVPSSGQVVEGTFRIQIAVANASAVTITVDPSMTVALQRLSVLPWIPVLSITTTAPPAAPALGDTYLVPTGATGSWAAAVGKIAEWTAAGWAMTAPRDGHGIGLPDGTQLIRVGGVYVNALVLRTLANIPVDSYVSAPPGAPPEGAQHLIAAAPTGAWAGKAGQIARWIGGAWRYEIPRAGRVATYWNGARHVTLRYDGAAWAEWLASTTAPGPVQLAASLTDQAAVPTVSLVQTAASIVGRTLIYTASGPFIVPAGVTSVEVEGWAPGGAGGASSDGFGGSLPVGSAGAGGGAGAYGYKRLTGLVPGTQIPVTIGQGGLGVGNAALSGGNGGSTSFGSHMTLGGGQGGPSGRNATILGGSGGAPTGADLGASGGRGGTGGPSSTFAAEFLLHIWNKGGLPARPLASMSLFGTGAAGTGYGDGGSGASGGSGLAGGNGAPGLLIVRW